MYNLKKLNKKELRENTIALVKKEKQYTLAVIAHLEEIEKRRLYAELGYSSMFAFVVRELKFTENEAQIRISCMRFTVSNPEVKEKIASGDLSLTNLNLAALSIKRQESATGKKFNSEEKAKVLAVIENKSTRQAKIALTAMEENMAAPEKELLYKVEITEKGLKILNEIKEIIGDYKDSELLENILDEKIASLKLKEKKTLEEAMNKQKSPSIVLNQGDALGNESAKHSRYIPKKVRKEVMARAQSRCEYVSPITGRRCTEVHHLEFDHKVAYALGGPNTVDNIILTCSAHNKFRAIQTFGHKKMDKYLNREISEGNSLKNTLFAKSDRATISIPTHTFS